MRPSQALMISTASPLRGGAVGFSGAEEICEAHCDALLEKLRLVDP